jgi:hypothetical protein
MEVIDMDTVSKNEEPGTPAAPGAVIVVSDGLLAGVVAAYVVTDSLLATAIAAAASSMVALAMVLRPRIWHAPR